MKSLKSAYRLPFYLAIASLLFSCASQTERYQAVKVGMEKHDVLELLGNPKITRRYRGVDRWQYVFYNEGIRSEKQIHFKQGNVIYKGDRPLPAVSADEQDRVNAQENATIAQRHAREREQRYNPASRQRLQNDYMKFMNGGRKALNPKFRPIEGGSQ